TPIVLTLLVAPNGGPKRLPQADLHLRVNEGLVMPFGSIEDRLGVGEEQLATKLSTHVDLMADQADGVAKRKTAHNLVNLHHSSQRVSTTPRIEHEPKLLLMLMLRVSSWRIAKDHVDVGALLRQSLAGLDVKRHAGKRTAGEDDL